MQDIYTPRTHEEALDIFGTLNLAQEASVVYEFSRLSFQNKGVDLDMVIKAFHFDMVKAESEGKSRFTSLYTSFYTFCISHDYFQFGEKFYFNNLKDTRQKMFSLIAESLYAGYQFSKTI